MLFLLASFLGGSDSQVAWPCLLTQRVSLMDGFAKRKKTPLPISISVRLRPLSNRNDTKHLQEVPPSQLETFFFFANHQNSSQKNSAGLKNRTIFSLEPRRIQELPHVSGEHFIPELCTPWLLSSSAHHTLYH